MHFGLTEEQEMIVSTVRSFVENEIYPHEQDVERSGEVPRDLGEAIKQKVIELGFYACNFPEEVGGAGLSHLDFTLVERELGRDLKGSVISVGHTSSLEGHISQVSAQRRGWFC